jgi:hypothetical protein
MYQLLHEVWEVLDEGRTTSLFLAGPRGASARRMLGPNAKLVTTFWASSHFEAASLYYSLVDWGNYHVGFPEDYEAYSADWVAEQVQAGIKRVDNR